MTEDNTKTMAKAADLAKIRQAMAKFTPAGLRALKRSAAAAERRTVFYTTWSWADEAGVYYGEDGAWLYQALPISVLTAGTGAFQALLDALATKLPGRSVHLLTYQWEEAATVPAGLPAGQRTYLLDSLRLVVPGQVFLVGVKLEEDPEALKRRAAPKAVFGETVERILGEWVPSFDDFADDVAQVASVLATFGGTAPTGGAQDMLEGWYSLGVPKDLDVDETDDTIHVKGAQTIELASVRSFTDIAPAAPSAPPSAGAAGTLVISARGTLGTSKVDVSTDEQIGVLESASIVIGRHTAVMTGTLSAACSAMDGVEFKPLPMRQMPALSETLPCSPMRVEANLHRVDAAKLTLAGFNEPIPAGDRTGLLAGMVEPNFSYPLYLDLFSTPGYTVTVAGGTRTGQAVLVEHLATQGRLNRRKVLFVNHDTDLGLGLVGTPEEPAVVAEPVPGLLDPFAHLGSLGPHAFMHVVRQALPQLGEPTLERIGNELARAGVAKVTTATRAMRLLSDPVHAAQLLKFSRTPAGRLLFAPDDQQQPAAPVTVWNAPTLLAGIEDPAQRAILEDLMLAVAHAYTRAGLLVTDNGRWGAGTVTHAARTHLGADLGAAIVVTDSAANLLGGPLPEATVTMVLSHEGDEPAAFFTSRGIRNAEELCAWLRTAGAEVDGGVMVRPDRGFVFDARGNKAAFLVGPVPADRIRSYSRGQALAYEMDTTATSRR